MATTTTSLQSVSVPAERALFAQPQFVFWDTATAGALDVTLAPAQATQIVRLLRMTLSYSAAPAVSVLQVLDGTTVIYQVEISATGPFVYDFDFSAKPLRASIGATLHLKVGSAGGSVVQTLVGVGDQVMQS